MRVNLSFFHTVPWWPTWSRNGRLAKEVKFFVHLTAMNSKRAQISWLFSWASCDAATAAAAAVAAEAVGGCCAAGRALRQGSSSVEHRLFSSLNGGKFKLVLEVRILKKLIPFGGWFEAKHEAADDSKVEVWLADGNLISDEGKWPDLSFRVSKKIFKEK